MYEYQTLKLKVKKKKKRRKVGGLKRRMFLIFGFKQIDKMNYEKGNTNRWQARLTGNGQQHNRVSITSRRLFRATFETACTIHPIRQAIRQSVSQSVGQSVSYSETSRR